jgi:hypothetical protein
LQQSCAEASDTNSNPGAFSDKTTVDAAVVEESVLSTCVRCHSGNKPPNLASLAGIMSNIGKIQTEVNSNSMPPADAGYSPLTDCQKEILQEWVAEGMPAKSNKKVLELSHCQQTGPKNPVETPILEMPLNYQTLTAKILQPRCLHCHNPNSSDVDASAILLFPYAQLTKHKNLLGSDSANSQFFNLVSRADEERMPPPEDSSPLPAEELEFIKRWIAAGHPEN